MQAVLQNLPPGGRVSLIRLRSLGDCVLTTPALRILKQARPDLEAAVVVEDRFRAVFEHNPDVAALLPPRIPDLLRWRPLLCLNLHGGGRSATLTAFSGAPWRAGFAHFRFPYLYNIRIPRAQEILGEERKVHTAEHLASAMFYLGAPRLAIPRASLFVEQARDLPGAYAVLHPFASHPSKTWPAQRFLAVADHIRRSLDLDPVVIAGAGDDVAPFAGCRIVQAAPLTKVKALIQAAALFVGNDSGPAHMAAAFGIPLVVIFGTSDVDVWRPWQTPAEIVAAKGPIGSVPESDVVAAMGRLRVHA